MLPQLSQRRMHTRLTSRAGNRQPIDVNRLTQRLTLIEQPCGFHQQLKLSTAQVVRRHSFPPKRLAARREISRPGGAGRGAA